MSNRVLLQNGSETIAPVCTEDTATSARRETAKRDALHEQLSRLASAHEWPVDEEHDDRRDIDRARRHPCAAFHVNTHIDCVERTHFSALSLTAAPAEAVRGSAVQSKHDGAHPGPHPGVPREPRQQSNIQTGKQPQRMAPPATRNIMHNVSRDVMPGAQPQHAVRHAAVMSRPVHDGYPQGRNASVTHGVVAARTTAPYDAGFATYCWSMNWLVVDAQAAEEASDRFDYALIGDQADEAAADAHIEERGAQRQRTGRESRSGRIRTLRPSSGLGEDRVESIAHSASLRMKGAAVYAPSMRVAPAGVQPAANGVPAYGEVATWRLHYTFRSWHGAPSIELTQDRASFDMTGRAGRFMVAVTASNNEVSAAARRKIACALARDDAPGELADATIAPVRAVTA